MSDVTIPSRLRWMRHLRNQTLAEGVHPNRHANEYCNIIIQHQRTPMDPAEVEDRMARKILHEVEQQRQELNAEYDYATFLNHAIEKMV